jgi:hypothetical protein
VETLDTSSPLPADETGETAVAALFQARYLDMVRLAVLLGADDAEDIAQEAFARLLTRHVPLRDPGAALAYVRSTVCNLTRKRWRHSLVVRSRTPAMPDEASPEHTAILREDHREVLAALAALPARKRWTMSSEEPGVTNLEPAGFTYPDPPRVDWTFRGHRRVIVASQACTCVVPSTGLTSKVSAISDSTTQPSLNAARSSSARTRRGPQVPGCRSLKHMR